MGSSSGYFIRLFVIVLVIGMTTGNSGSIINRHSSGDIFSLPPGTYLLPLYSRIKKNEIFLLLFVTHLNDYYSPLSRVHHFPKGLLYLILFTKHKVRDA